MQQQEMFVLHCVSHSSDEYNMGIGSTNVVQVPVAFTDAAKQTKHFVDALCAKIRTSGFAIVKAATGATGRTLRKHGLKPIPLRVGSAGFTAVGCSVTFSRFQGRESVYVGLLPAKHKLHSGILAAEYSNPAVMTALLSGACSYIQHWLETEAKHMFDSS
jgi:hypothetical protein